MKLRQKVIFLAITPLILAMCGIALAVRHQAIMLAQQQRATIQQAYLASKEAELKHYVTLASHSIAHLYRSGRKDPATLEEAKRILGALSYGDDGYFFIYDMQGNSLMHPRQPELVGQNLWQLRDASGRLTIQNLLQRAKTGGGFERYNWIKPSSHKPAPKLGYVILMPDWGWMMGTGIYLDDVDDALARVDTQQSGNIRSTMLWIAAIAILSSLALAVSGLALNISELRVADAKLKVLTQRVVESQEEERARLSRDLHDGISQWLVSIKLQIEAGIIRLTGTAEQQAKAQATFERTAEQLNNVLGEVRRISHNLRPAILDDLGLAAALEHLAGEFSDNSRTPVVFRAEGGSEGLSDVANTVLFRIAQEALTNIERHAQASQIVIELSGSPHRVALRIADDGIGFDTDGIALHPKHGIGLRNMMERMEAIGGDLLITSSPSGTVVLARVDLTI
ncbi:cache domain-containing protein [Janthinobacterium agaricidamnosum]|uniref:Histidine kinase-, DNA gyrase B-, and HSP90-like ATPase family protein n=1 Tax=Janthinobacterium agaricidamnosum NBRC 102515 = DSM 9628 TaxID=1349767 RepID=W0VAU5_9BURK|nr:cache domain-containing protein [Janthinobacterium agaricidamnosum]CDG84397.1 histidine kinase-, DNA gyrase B-, and HSP90-like ATPase family protein [Janthinobacterium agaricidamnosum NBRC 102515 = DSM 9628]